MGFSSPGSKRKTIDLGSVDIVVKKNTCLQDITTRISPITVADEAKGIVGRYGYLRMVRVLSRTLALYLKSEEYRQFVKKVREDGVTSENMDVDFGYGLCVGRKT